MYTQYEKLTYKELMMNQFYIMWMGLYKWKGISSEWSHYLMREMWLKGTCSAFLADVPGEKQVWIAPYAPYYFTGNNTPSKVTIINERSVPGYPSEYKILDVISNQNKQGTIALGWALPSKRPVKLYFEFFATKMAELQEQIDQNNQQIVLPMGVPTTSRKEEFTKQLRIAIKNKEPLIPIYGESASLFRPQTLSNQFVGDKLIDQIHRWMNEAKTLLGIDASGEEKRERVNMDEANSNNAIINLFREINLDCVREFAYNINLLGVNVSVSPNTEKVTSVSEKGVKDGKIQTHQDDILPKNE